MDYKKTAQQVYKLIGGKENLVSGAHCATRLRLVIVDNDKCDKDAIENLEGVKGVFFASGQLQVIFGTGVVNKVYAEFAQLADLGEVTKEEVKKAAAKNQNPLQRAVKALGDIFVPIIPAIVASGLLMGLLEGLAKVFPAMTESGTYTIIHLFSNAAFVFLPILIAVSAARAFGGNIYLGAVIGMIMIHPDLMNAWVAVSEKNLPSAEAWFGLYDIHLVGYQGHVIPVVIAVWFMCFLEKRLHKIVPEMFDLFVTPLVTVLVTGYCTLTIFGPVFSVLENGVLSAIQQLITLPYGIGGLICGAVYAITVVAGVHHMYNALEAGLLSATGFNIWMPIATAANVAQGGAALALALKTKNKKTKAMALPASLSAFLGITEPAIFGVNLRFMKPFVAGCIGGGVGALFASMMRVKATSYGITGIFGVLITTDFLVAYLLTMLIAAGVSFLLSWFLYKEVPEGQESGKENTKETKEEPETQKAGIEEAEAVEEENAGLPETDTAEILGSPLKGQAIPLSEVPDETFASGVLGQGAAVIPMEGKVVAPCDGEVATVFDTRHAIGLVSDKGAEILIHVGINTVDLKGEPFTVHVKDGDRIKKGDLLLEFDMDAIREKGLSLATPVILTNGDSYGQICLKKEGTIEYGEDFIEGR